MQCLAPRQELATFLKNRRARLTPDDVGIIGGLNRRTPGLRREEVAELAGLGLAWYTWLEQARDINVSDDVLDAIARALRMNADERAHLFSLAHSAKGVRHPVGPNEHGVTVGQQAVLEALDPSPAHIRDERWDLLAWNRSFAEATRFDRRPPEERNLLWLLFTNDSSIDLLVDWRSTAAFAVAQFRFECSRLLNDPKVVDLIERLERESPLFGELWSRHDVASGVGSRTEWTRPFGGRTTFERNIFPVESPTDPGLHGGAQRRMAVLVPV